MQSISLNFVGLYTGVTGLEGVVGRGGGGGEFECLEEFLWTGVAGIPKV